MAPLTGAGAVVPTHSRGLWEKALDSLKDEDLKRRLLSSVSRKRDVLVGRSQIRSRTPLIPESDAAES